MAFRGFGCAAQIKKFTCFSMDLHAQNQEFTCRPCGYRQSHIFSHKTLHVKHVTPLSPYYYGDQ